MFTRYKKNTKGKNIPLAHVYTKEEHKIEKSKLDRDALFVIKKLQSNGEKAYLVGGAVRDLLVHKAPKDFDISTSADPKTIQKIFWNSRLIGRRFKIVHLYFNDKIIEVTTFRSDENKGNNIFGTMEQDAKRRDFSINSLYYNPLDEHLVDFNNAMSDIKKNVIRSIIPLRYSFKEDPVRMIRAIKYSISTGFKLRLDLYLSIKMNAHLIQGIPISRLTEEMNKIMSSEHSKLILTALSKFGILEYMMPCFAVYIKYPEVIASLEELDLILKEKKKEGVSLSLLIYYLVRSIIVLEDKEGLSIFERQKEVFRQIKVAIAPLTPPNYEIEHAAERILIDNGYKNQLKKKNRPKKKKTFNKAVTKNTKKI